MVGEILHEVCLEGTTSVIYVSFAKEVCVSGSFKWRWNFSNLHCVVVVKWLWQLYLEVEVIYCILYILILLQRALCGRGLCWRYFINDLDMHRHVMEILLLCW